MGIFDFNPVQDTNYKYDPIGGQNGLPGYQNYYNLVNSGDFADYVKGSMIGLAGHQKNTIGNNVLGYIPQYQGLYNQSLGLTNQINNSTGLYNNTYNQVNNAGNSLLNMTGGQLEALSQGKLSPEYDQAFNASLNAINAGKSNAQQTIKDSVRSEAAARGLLSSAGAIESEAANLANLDVNQANQIANLYSQKADTVNQNILNATNIRGGLASQAGMTYGSNANTLNGLINAISSGGKGLEFAGSLLGAQQDTYKAQSDLNTALSNYLAQAGGLSVNQQQAQAAQRQANKFLGIF